jgi:hypothetical protein
MNRYAKLIAFWIAGPFVVAYLVLRILDLAEFLHSLQF